MSEILMRAGRYVQRWLRITGATAALSICVMTPCTVRAQDAAKPMPMKAMAKDADPGWEARMDAQRNTTFNLHEDSMRSYSLCTFALSVLASTLSFAQQQPAAAPQQRGGMGGMNMQETARPIENGGIFVDGWMGKVDANAEKQGQGVKDSRFAKEGNDFHVTTGPAITYWNPKMTANGDYTVSATFTEPKYMNRNSHPHPYGIVIAGNDMATANESDLYCAAYGNGRFIVRGFGPDAFQVNGRGEANDAVHKAAGQDQPVTQKIALQVKGDKVSCIINDTVVGSYNKADLVAPGKLKSTDGVYGIRFAHNTDATVNDFKITKP